MKRSMVVAAVALSVTVGMVGPAHADDGSATAQAVLADADALHEAVSAAVGAQVAATAPSDSAADGGAADQTADPGSTDPSPAIPNVDPSPTEPPSSTPDPAAAAPSTVDSAPATPAVGGPDDPATAPDTTTVAPLVASGDTATASTDLGQVTVDSTDADAVTVDGASTDVTIGLPDGGSGDQQKVVGDGTVVVPSASGTAAAVQTFTGLVRVVAVVADQQQADSLRFPIQVGGGQLQATEDGGYDVVTPDGAIQASIAAPWARDANGTQLPTSYSWDGSALVQHVDTTGAVFPVVADPAISQYKRESKRFQGVSMRTRGYIPDACLNNDVPCMNGSGGFKAECTAQAYAIKELSRRRLSSWEKIWGQRVDDNVDWEVGPGNDSPAVEQSTCAGDTPSRWRVDIVSDSRLILEVKEWDGPATPNRVQQQLLNYRIWGAAHRIDFVYDNELIKEQWSRCYKDATWGGRTWCAWAGAPGEVYFKRLDQLPDRVRRTIVNRYEDRRGMPFHVPLPIFEAMTNPSFEFELVP